MVCRRHDGTSERQIKSVAVWAATVRMGRGRDLRSKRGVGTLPARESEQFPSYVSHSRGSETSRWRVPGYPCTPHVKRITAGRMERAEAGMELVCLLVFVRFEIASTLGKLDQAPSPHHVNLLDFSRRGLPPLRLIRAQGIRHSRLLPSTLFGILFETDSPVPTPSLGDPVHV